MCPPCGPRPRPAVAKGAFLVDADTLGKAQADTGALKMGEFAVQASQKVQLDIDDAPFLAEPEETAPPPAVRREAALAMSAADDEAAKKRARRKRLIVRGSAAVFGLAVIAAGAAWFMRGTAPVPTPALPEPTVIVVPSPKSVAGPPQYKIEFAPFMVEQRENGEVHFLQARFAGISQLEGVINEARNKQLVLRDSIYYYLRNKTHQYLVNPENALTIKQDLQDIVNGILTQGKMDDILLVNYIIK